MFARERFPHPYEECFVLLPDCCGISQSTLLWGLASSLTLVPLSYRCGISQSTLLQDPASSLTLVPLSDRRGISQSTPIPGPASSLAQSPVFGFDANCNAPNFFSQRWAWAVSGFLISFPKLYEIESFQAYQSEGRKGRGRHH